MSYAKRCAIARIAAEIFFPQRIRLKLHQHGYSEGQDDSTAVAALLESLILPAETADDDSSEQQPAKTKAKAKLKDGKQDWRPRRRVRTCVSSMCNSDEFGPKVAAEARRRGFFQATRRAFLGDGLAWNWTLQSRWFPDFVPILDFVHPTTYVYEASRVVAGDEEQAWSLCVCWLQACWEGRVSSVLAELRNWQAIHPTAPDEKLEDMRQSSVSPRLMHVAMTLERSFVGHVCIMKTTLSEWITRLIVAWAFH